MSGWGWGRGGVGSGEGKVRSCYFWGVRAATKGERTREAILERAVEEAVRSGIEGLTIGSLASSTGMSKSGLFAHFGSKESLQLAVLETAATQFSDAVVVPALAAPRGLARLRRLVELWLECGCSRMPGGCLVVKAGMELDDRPGPLRDHLRDIHARLADSLARIVAGAVEEGELDPATDTTRFAADVYAVMLGFYHSHRLLEDPRAHERAIAAVEALVTAARPTRARPPAQPAPEGRRRRPQTEDDS